jgi:hypothetical protein
MRAASRSPPRRTHACRIELAERRALLSAPVDWSVGIGSPLDDAAADVAFDSQGNAIVMGTFGGTMDADPGPGVARLTSNGGKDVFVTKYATGGLLVWARSFGGPGDEEAGALVLDDLGNVYLTGAFYGTVDFCPTRAVAPATSRGGADIFIACWSSRGYFHWLRTLGDRGYDTGRGIARDPRNGDVLVGGAFKRMLEFGEEWFANPDVRVPPIHSVGGTDSFVVGVSRDGFYRGTLHQGGAGNDATNHVAFSDGNVWNAGEITDTAVLALGASGSDVPPPQDVTYPARVRDVFVTRWLRTTAAFTYGQSYHFGSADADYVNGLAAGPGGTFILGTYIGDLNGRPSHSGSRDLFLIKVGPDEMIRIGGREDDVAGRIATDTAGNVYVTGAHRGTLGIYSQEPPVYLPPVARFDGFVARFSSTLVCDWADGLNGTGDDYAGAVAVNPAGGFALAGQFAGRVDRAGDGSTQHVSNGGTDVLLAAYEQED